MRYPEGDGLDLGDLLAELGGVDGLFDGVGVGDAELALDAVLAPRGDVLVCGLDIVQDS
jgi:hypothetical protein